MSSIVCQNNKVYAHTITVLKVLRRRPGGRVRVFRLYFYIQLQKKGSGVRGEGSNEDDNRPNLRTVTS